MNPLTDSTMAMRNVVLRFLLWILGIAAVLGIAALLADWEYSGETLGSAVSLAFMCALILPVAPSIPGAQLSWISIAWCSYLLVAESCFLIAIWSNGNYAEQSMGCAGVLLLSLVVAATGIRRMDGADTSTRVAEKSLMIGSGIAAAIGLLAPFSTGAQTGLLVSEWLTCLAAAVVVAACLTGLGSVSRIRRAAVCAGLITCALALAGWSNLWLMLFVDRGMVVGAAATALGGWNHVDDIRTISLGLTTIAVSIGVGIFASRSILRGLSRHLPALAVLMTATAGTTATYLVAFNPNMNSFLWRITGACIVVDVCVLLGCLILHKLHAAEIERLSHSEALGGARMRCPRCSAAFSATAGESTCPTCKLVVILGFKDSSCLSCQYDLRTTAQGAPCPECGRVTQPQRAVAVARQATP